MLGKRKKLLQDMLPGLEATLRQQTVREGIATSKGVEYFALQLKERAANGPLGREPAWYNVDAQLLSGLDELLNLGGSMLPGGDVRAETIAALDAATCKQYGFVPGAFTKAVAKGLRELRSMDGHVRKAAVEVLGASAEAMVHHGAAVVQRLEDSDRDVRLAAVKALGASAEAMTQHSAAVVQRLEDSDGYVRLAAEKVLRKMPSNCVHNCEPFAEAVPLSDDDDFDE